MEQIETALLAGHRKVNLHGIEIQLRPLKRDTYNNKVREAKQRAKELIRILNS